MQLRFDMGKLQPLAYKAMYELDKYVMASAIGRLQREMIKIRASQLNGCAFCINHHTRDARKMGETEQRIYLMSVWREAGDLFTEEEQIMLEMTEEITFIHLQGLSDALYQKACHLLGEEKTAQVMMAIIAINGWNRIGVGLNMQPEP